MWCLFYIFYIQWICMRCVCIYSCICIPQHITKIKHLEFEKATVLRVSTFQPPQWWLNGFDRHIATSRLSAKQSASDFSQAKRGVVPWGIWKTRLHFVDPEIQPFFRGNFVGSLGSWRLTLFIKLFTFQSGSEWHTSLDQSRSRCCGDTFLELGV